MQVKVTKAFRGVEDGKVYPRRIDVGEIIEGDLAAVAIKEKWAVAVSAAAPASEPVQAQAPKAQELAPVADQASEEPLQVAIPANWKSLKLVDLRVLAAQFTDGDVADPKRAASVIEAELARRKG